MSCNRIQKLLVESQTRELTISENQEIEIHLHSCSQCFENSKHESILSNIIQNASETDKTYIIPQKIMRLRVEQQMQNKPVENSYFNFFKKPILASLMTTALIVIVIVYLYLPEQNRTSYEYSVAFDGIDLALVENNDVICDMLYTVGLPEASIDVIGCEQTCELLIFDLKTQEEAEKVIEILHTIDQNVIKSDIIKTKQYNI